MYVIESNLTSTKKDKVISAIGAALLMFLFLLLMAYVTIGMPDPPIISKQGALELDFGYVEAGFGEPDQGGPSSTAPAQGGEIGGSSAASNGGSPPKAVVTSNKGTETNYHKVKTAISAGTTTQKADARLGKLKGRKSGNASKEGNPNGWKNGRGTEGMGNGTNSGINGNGGREPRKGGSGGVYAEFRNFEISSSTVKITADGRGKIRCSVKVDCNGKWSIVRAGLMGTTYTGQPTDANYRNVFKQAMRGVIFKKTGTDCPETRTVTADIQPE